MTVPQVGDRVLVEAEVRTCLDGDGDVLIATGANVDNQRGATYGWVAASSLRPWTERDGES